MVGIPFAIPFLAHETYIYLYLPSSFIKPIIMSASLAVSTGARRKWGSDLGGAIAYNARDVLRRLARLGKSTSFL